MARLCVFKPILFKKREGCVSMNMIMVKEGLRMFIVFFGVLLLDLVAYWFQWVE